ncbi:HIT domain-containing protein [Stutzerimonas urumqiensis]|uniref:HIT domain-containing protein n=1 Tax=Stutzerimonas urumqiensis TaxID=638269 RepID=UPI000EB0E57B|nr:HIT domain-containing protein [Stutzerimonas urumqiensis]
MFELDARLAGDTHAMGDLPLSRLLLMNDARYPWFILVPRREEISEVFQLDAPDREALWNETVQLSEGVKDAFGAHKMNVATLGNVVSQLHVHVVARRREDAVWPDPVWGRPPAVPYDQAQVEAIKERLRVVLGSCVAWT